MKCPHCGKEFNAGKVMGAARTPKKTAAAKKRGEWMKKAFANQRKMETNFANEADTANRSGASRPPTPFVSGGLATGVTAVETRLAHDTGHQFIAPKGSFSKEDLKAMIAGGVPASEKIGVILTENGYKWAPGSEPPDLHDTPCAPFDLNLEGEPHRVTQMGKKLGLFYLGGGEPVFNRYLSPGELERFWDMRNKL